MASPERFSTHRLVDKVHSLDKPASWKRQATAALNKAAKMERKRIFQSLGSEMVELIDKLIQSTDSASDSSHTRSPSPSLLDATRFIRALLAAKEPQGQVLSLDGDGVFLHMEPRQEPNKLFVRACYAELFDLICNASFKYHIVIGTPGIGKSWFLYYMLFRLLRNPSSPPPPVILWESCGFPGMFCYTHKSREVVCGSRQDFETELGNKDAWYIADGVPPLRAKARTVLLTWPEYRTYKDMRKSGATMLWMPVWSEQEILECRSKLYHTVSEERVQELYRHYGGVARQVLMMPLLKPECGLDMLLADLKDAVSKYGIEKLIALAGSTDSDNERIHHLVHVIPHPGFQLMDLQFASPWVEGIFAEEVKTLDTLRLRRLLQSCMLCGTLDGLVRKEMVQRTLNRGGGS